MCIHLPALLSTKHIIDTLVPVSVSGYTVIYIWRVNACWYCCFGVFKITILAKMQVASMKANQWHYLPNGAIVFAKAAARLIKKRCVLPMVVHSETCACCRKRFARRKATTPTITLEVVQVRMRLQGLWTGAIERTRTTVHHISRKIKSIKKA